VILKLPYRIASTTLSNATRYRTGRLPCTGTGTACCGLWVGGWLVGGLVVGGWWVVAAGTMNADTTSLSLGLRVLGLPAGMVGKTEDGSFMYLYSNENSYVRVFILLHATQDFYENIVVSKYS
jgi:hypothetical protein